MTEHTGPAVPAVSQLSVRKGLHPGYCSGFSLIEALVVLAIVAVLTAVSGTTLLGLLPEAGMNRATRTIVSMCRHARFEAIKRHEQIRLQCDKGQNTCEVRIKKDNSLLRRFNLTELKHQHVLEKTYTTHFNDRGRASMAGTIIIHNSAGLSRSVIVRPSGSVVTE
jgi:type IV fimbrial biogenesis protein FimT